jgi:hypothetical protein
MIKAYHLIAPYLVNHFLSLAAARVVHVHVQFDRTFRPGRILRMLLQIRQYEANEMVLSECFVRVKSISGVQAFTSTKDRNRRF